MEDGINFQEEGGIQPFEVPVFFCELPFYKHHQAKVFHSFGLGEVFGIEFSAYE